MRYKIPLFLILFNIFSAEAFAELEIQVIPYRIANPTDNFAVETGKEYAKLVSIAAELSKDIVIMPHEKVYTALKKLSLNYQATITEDDLIAVGRHGKSEYILTGTLTKTKGQYSAESILYSVKSKKIISKCSVFSQDLYSLAEEEINEIFFNIANKKRTVTDKQVDAVILLDLTYKTSGEWASIKSGIMEFSESASGNWTLNTEIGIIPFSQKHALLNKYAQAKSSQSLKEKLNSLTPSGNASIKHFQNALNYAVKNNPWRKNSEKILLIVSNSENIKGKFLEQSALTAKARKISINTLSLGLVKEGALDTMKQFANIGSGRHYSTAYHQRTYNEKGNPVDMFYEDGRIFQTAVYDDAWKNGLFEDSRRKQSVIQKPRSFLNEIFYDEKKYNINPYNISQYYPTLLQINVINREKLENNIVSIMQKIAENFAGTNAGESNKKIISKAQISDGDVVFLIPVSDEKDLAFFKKKLAAGRFFSLGIVVKKSPDDPYGITSYPDLNVTGIQEDFVPDLIKTSFGKIIKDPEYFISNGLLTPPVWFLDVKVIKLDNLKKERDIRDLNK